jgi:cephalosporin hydroxylase
MDQTFDQEKLANIRRLGAERRLKDASVQWVTEVSRCRYSYNFTWLGRPIIQFPQDIVALQEIVWQVKPDLIVETGVAHGGSLVLYASLLQLLGGNGHVVGIDVHIRDHNRRELANHPLADRISLVEGSSSDPRVVTQVQEIAATRKSVLVALDSNHTHEHVLAELRLYSPLVTRGSYLVVFDTIIQDMPHDFFPGRGWGHGNNPRTAVEAFLLENDRFAVDTEMDNKLLITVAPGGYLRCIKD